MWESRRRGPRGGTELPPVRSDAVGAGSSARSGTVEARRPVRTAMAVGLAVAVIGIAAVVSYPIVREEMTAVRNGAAAPQPAASPTTASRRLRIRRQRVRRLRSRQS